jgi:hypothetical protein
MESQGHPPVSHVAYIMLNFRRAQSLPMLVAVKVESSERKRNFIYRVQTKQQINAYRSLERPLPERDGT